ncbi:MAG: hypothetical protein R6U96_09420 [Promethearchaeia archaeon]
MAEKKDLKERFGKLGLTLVNDVQNEIKELRQDTLFQKAEIKKKYMEKAEQESKKVKKSFKETYRSTINQKFSSVSLRFKEGFLNLKSFLLNDLKRGIHDFIGDKIKGNYKSYQEFIKKNLQSICEENIESSQEFVLILNARDYDYFKDKINVLKENIQNSFQLEKGSKAFTGGFKIYIEEEQISYDSTIDNLFEQYSDYIEREFSKIVSDEGIDKILQEFEQFTEKKKSEMKEYLKEYERI